MYTRQVKFYFGIVKINSFAAFGVFIVMGGSRNRMAIEFAGYNYKYIGELIYNGCLAVNKT